MRRAVAAPSPHRATSKSIRDPLPSALRTVSASREMWAEFMCSGDSRQCPAARDEPQCLTRVETAPARVARFVSRASLLEPPAAKRHAIVHDGAKYQGNDLL